MLKHLRATECSQEVPSCCCVANGDTSQPSTAIGFFISQLNEAFNIKDGNTLVVIMTIIVTRSTPARLQILSIVAKDRSHG